MHSEEMATAISEVNVSPDSGLISALQNILARSRVIIPHLETPYSRCPNTDHSTIDRKDLSISAIVTDRQQQLDAVLHEISGLETILDRVKNLHQQLVEKKEKITQSMILHKGLVSGLWGLPTEVMAKIFHHCLPEFRQWQRAYSSPEFDPTQNAPMLLTRICRQWRDVVVDTPGLWCRFYLINHRNWEQASSCYNTWLERSRGFPLSLALKCGGNDAINLRSVLQPYVGQISSLYVESLFSSNPEPVLNNLPALQELAIRTYIFDMPAISRIILRLPFTSTPHSFKLVGLELGFKRITYLSPIFAQLTKIEMTIRSPNALLHLLQLSPNLSSLTVHLGFGRIKRALTPFTHTKLQALDIDYDENTLPSLLDALSLPNLRVFVARDGPQPWPHEQLKALLARSNCPLESLIFHIGGTTDEHRAEYIALMPSLEVVLDPTHASDCLEA